MRYPTRLRSLPWLIIVGLAVPGIAVPVLAQEPAANEKPAIMPSEPVAAATVNQLAALRTFPTSYKLTDLNSQWRRFTLNDTNDSSLQDVSMRMAANMRLLERFGIGVYFTKGDSVTLAKESYLVAYRIDQDMTQRELQTAMQSIWGHGHGDQDSGNDKFLPNTKLTLTLLNLRASGSLNDLTKFDPAREIMGPGDITAASTNNLRRLGRTLQQVAQYQVLPLKDIATMRRSLQNQLHDTNDRPFKHPLTQEPYRVNAKVAGKRSKQVSNRRLIPAIYEAKPGTDNKRGVVFVDGHVERIHEALWDVTIKREPVGPTAKEIHTISAQRLRRLNNLLLMIARNYSSGTLPALGTPNEVRNLQNWGGYEPDMYVHPKSNKRYLANKALSKKKLASFPNRKAVISFYEATPGSDNLYGVVFLDGSTRRVSKDDLSRILSGKKSSKRRSVKKN